MLKKLRERTCSLHWPLSIVLPVAFPCPDGLTYHKSKLDNIFQERAHSSLQIPANMRGAPLCIVWGHTLKAERECGDQDGSHRQCPNSVCIAWVQASVDPTGAIPAAGAPGLIQHPLPPPSQVSSPMRSGRKPHLQWACLVTLGPSAGHGPSGLRITPMPRGWSYCMRRGCSTCLLGWAPQQGRCHPPRM